MNRIKDKRKRPLRDCLKKKTLRRKILKWGDSRLYQECSPVDFNNEEDVELAVKIIKDLMQVAKVCPTCVGLSANQLGYTKHIMIVKFPESTEFYLLINAELRDQSITTETKIESCMSFPGKRMEVARPTVIKIRFQDCLGNMGDLACRDMEARIILHELDHLQGKPALGKMI